jgi:hypothetical protein
MGMLSRCSNPNEPEYANYGARGIFVCDRWRDSFKAFFSDMGPKPTRAHSIDRINHNGPYSPENCRWATHLEQANNKRSTHWITFEGRTQTFSQWADERGIPRSTLWKRLLVKKWPLEKALHR